MANKLGILCHISSIPSDYGIGDFGRSARDFIDTLSQNNINIWQILPLNETNKYNCPYASTCYFSYDEMFVDPEQLLRDNLIEDKDLKELRKLSVCDKVNYKVIKREKHKLLCKAYDNIDNGIKLELEQFVLNKPYILDFAIYKVLLDVFKQKDWRKIPKKFRNKTNAEYKKLVIDNKVDIFKYVYFQYVLHVQWNSIIEYAKQKNITILGDLPIYPEPNSFDVFNNPNMYLLDKKTLKPTVFGGVPADAFASNGQNWETCVYNWEELKTNNYCYLIDKIKLLLERYGILRLDHFLGYTIHYEIDASDVSKGQWIQAGGKEFFEELFKSVDMGRVVIEDLGLDKVEANNVRQQFNLSGMSVLSMAVGDTINPRYLPSGVGKNSIFYLVTHDSDTFMGYLNKLQPHEKIRFCENVGIDYNSDGEILINSIKKMINSNSDIVILQIQDLLFEDNSYRMNIPGNRQGCWEYRVRPDYKQQLNKTLMRIK